MYFNVHYWDCNRYNLLKMYFNNSICVIFLCYSKTLYITVMALLLGSYQHCLQIYFYGHLGAK